MRWVLSLLLSTLLGVGALYAVTDGFSALTVEGARRLAIARAPQPVPDLPMATSAGVDTTLGADLRDDGRVAIINFFYTRCVSLCLAQGALTGRLQEAIEAEHLQRRVRLISISFDPRDGAADLARYAQRMRADGAIWQFLAPARTGDIAPLLHAFGITVVPAPLGEFEHNAAFHVVTPDGRLVRIFSLDDPGLALAAAREQAQASGAQTGVVP